jgi:glucose/arabinose dehydrogenase
MDIVHFRTGGSRVGAATATSSIAQRRHAMTRKRRSSVVVGVFALVAAVMVTISAPASAHVAAGFEDVVVADVNGPTDLDWTPDGRMLVTSKGGQLWVIENGAVVSTPAIDLSSMMCTNGERALGAVAVHPEFSSNRYVYMYYTFKKNGTCDESEVDGPVNRLSRFVLGDDNTIDPASETLLFDTPPLYRDHHNGGDIAFGPDGFVYVTVGDGGTRRFDWPQDPGYLLGKVVRITDSGGIPPGNPHDGPDSARCNVDGVPPAGSPAGTKCQEVYAQGLRNPFRFALDPESSTPRFMINDVGQHSFEEINELTAPGADFGWPLREGPCVFDTVTECDAPPPGLTDPVHWYPHGINGGAATAGAFVPSGVWPAEYDGVYLFADYVFGAIYQLEDGPPECRTCTPPTSAYEAHAFTDAASVVSMAFGPHDGSQSLFYVTREGDGVHRIDYVGGANRAPVAVASADQVAGPAPLSVQFDASGSSDPDDDPLTYAWDFESDGTIDSTAIAPSHVYPVGGTFNAELTVSDPDGAMSTDVVRIDPGNNPPEPMIDAPAEGETFRVGETLTLTGLATDPDETLDDSSLVWEVRQHHAEHFHPFLEPTPGNGHSIVAPEPEDFLAATNSHLEVLLTATDSGGASTTVSRIIEPEKVDLTFESTPPGLDIVLDGFTLTTPVTVVSWADHSLNVNAPDQLDDSATQWNWTSWSDGGAQTHPLTVPDAPAIYSAAFEEGAAPAITLMPLDDATIRENRPDRQLGLDEVIEGDAQAVKHALLKFDVAGAADRAVASAKLRMFVTNSSPDGGTVHVAEHSNWSEDDVTWATAPATTGGPISSVGDANSSTWIETDVTDGVSGDGLVSFRLTSASPNGVDYASLQDPGGRLPELVIEFGEPSGPDNSPPTPPTGLSAVADTPTEIELSWSPASDNVAVTGYDIFRCDGPPSLFGVPCADLLLGVGPVTSYEDLSVLPLSTYSYEVRARDAAGNVSGESNVASATTPGPDLNPPSTPTALSATVLSPTSVELTWTASVDDVELAGYRVERDGTALPDTSAPTLVDAAATPGATHEYVVIAFDSAGNESDVSDPITVDMPLPPTETRFTATDDATIKESRPDSNRGDRDAIEADLSSRKDGLVKFDVVGSGSPAKVTLRLYVVDSSSSGGDIHLMTDSSWSEDSVTWANAPAGDGGMVASIGEVSSGTWVEVDLTGVVTGDGTWSFRITSPSSNGVDYASTEHTSGFAPEMVIEPGTASP